MTTLICLQKYFLIGFGSVFLLGGTLLSGFWPSIYRAVLKPELVLSNNSRSFDMWKQTPSGLPIYMDFYFFHWANPERTLDGTEKPRFIEKGPYVFREYHTKENISWHQNSTVTFMQIRKWIFMQNLTKPGLSLDDKINSVNPIAYTVSTLLKKKDLPMVERLAIDTALRLYQTKMYVTQPVRQLLFEGYEDPLLSILANLPDKIFPHPKMAKKFGWFFQHNMSSEFDGVSNMGTGSDNLKDLGNLKLWDYKPDTGFFEGECGKVKGTTGEVWPPNSAKEDSVTLFAPDLCSSLDLRSSGTEVVQGLTGTSFVGKENVFDNGTLYPENKCYMPSGTTIRRGVRSLSSCRFGAPILISFPHFYLADPAYAQALNGLSPVADSHQFKISLEESTGIPLTVSARLQINVQSSPVPGYGIFDRLPEVVLPVLWFDQHMAITPELAKSIWVVSVVPNYVTYGLIAMAVLGAVLLLIGMLMVRRDWHRTADSEELLKDTDDPSITPPVKNDQEPSQ